MAEAGKPKLKVFFKQKILWVCFLLFLCSFVFSPCLFLSHFATTPSKPGISRSSGQTVQMYRPRSSFPGRSFLKPMDFFNKKKYYLLVFLCSFLWGRQFALCPTCSKLYFFTKKHKVAFSSYIYVWYRLYLHLKPLVDFLAMGGEELLEIAFFRFSFFRRRVPPIESSLKGGYYHCDWKQI